MKTILRSALAVLTLCWAVPQTALAQPQAEIEMLSDPDGCAPYQVEVKNISNNNITDNTIFKLNFGDGSTIIFDTGTAAQDKIYTHTYASNCDSASKEIQPDSSDGYVIELIAYDKNDPDDKTRSTFRPVKVFESSIARLNGPKEGCVGNSLIFENFSSPNWCKSNTNSEYKYFWGDGTNDKTFQGASDTQPQHTITHTYSDTGTYEVILRAKTLDGSPINCGPDYDTLTVQINEPPQAQFSFTADPATQCIDNTIQFNNESTGGKNDYTWSISPNDGRNYINSTSPASNNPEVEFTKGGDYTVELTADNNCGSDQTSQTVTIHSLPSVDAGDNKAFCLNAGVQTLSGFSPSGGEWSGPGIIGTGPNFNPQDAGTGNHILTYSFKDSDGCTNFNTRQVEVKAIPQMEAGNDKDFCSSNTTVTLSGSPSGGTWSGSGVTADGNFTPSDAGNGDHDLVYTVTQNGCTVRDTLTASVTDPENVDAGSDEEFSLQDDDFTLNASPSGGSWSGRGVNGNTFVPSDAGIGLHILTYTVGSGTCQASDQRQMTVHDHPNVTVNSSGGSSAICPGGSVQLNASGAGNYSWTNSGSLSSSTGATVTAEPSTTTTYKVIGEDGNGFKDTAQVTVTVHLRPKVNNVSVDDDNPCAGETIQFNIDAEGQGLSYEWDFGDGNSGTGSNPNHSYNPANGKGSKTYTVEVKATSNKGCESALHQVQVTVRRKPVVDYNFAPNSPICSGDSYNFFSSGPAEGNNPSFSWDFGDGSTSNQPNPTHQFQAFGAGTKQFPVTLTVTANGGCQNSITKNVPVKRQPDLEIAGAGNGCLDSAKAASDSFSVEYNLFNFTPEPSASAIDEFQIDWGDGSSEAVPADSFPSNSGYLHFFDTLGLFNIEVVAVADNGCKTQRDTDFEIEEKPRARLIAPKQNKSCEPFKAVFVNATGNITATTVFTMDFGDGSPTVPLAPGDSIVHTYATNCDSSDGTFPNLGAGLDGYKATLTAENSCGKTVSSWEPIQIFAPPEAKFEYKPASPLEPVDFTNTSIPGRCAKNDTVTYFWDFDDGTKDTFKIAQPFKEPQQTLSHTYDSSGLYDVQLKACNYSPTGCGCTDTTIAVRVFARLQAAFSADTACFGSSTSFEDQSVNPNGSNMVAWNWEFGDSSGVSTQENPNYTYAKPGKYQVTLRVEDANGGRDTVQDSVEVLPLPVSNFSADTLCTGESVTIGSQTFDSTGMYSVTLTAASGCDSTVNLDLTVLEINASVTESGDTLQADPLNTTLYDYQWLDGQSQSIAGADDPLFNPQQNGQYSVVVLGENCRDTSEAVNFQVTSLDDPTKQAVLRIYPNPTTGRFTLETDQAGQLQILSLTGKQVYAAQVSQGKNSLSVDLPNGLFLVRLKTKDGNTRPKKLVIE